MCLCPVVWRCCICVSVSHCLGILYTCACVPLSGDTVRVCLCPIVWGYCTCVPVSRCLEILYVCACVPLSGDTVHVCLCPVVWRYCTCVPVSHCLGILYTCACGSIILGFMTETLKGSRSVLLYVTGPGSGCIQDVSPSGEQSA